MTATTAIGLGKGLGLLIAWIDEKLRQHYCPFEPRDYGTGPLGSVPVVFFDKSFVANLKSENLWIKQN